MTTYIHKFEKRYNLEDDFNQFFPYIIDSGKDLIDGQFDDPGLHVTASHGESLA